MSEEIKEEKLDSPLVVHKPTDASYQEMATDVVMNETRVEEESPTIERHRFKKSESQKENKTFVIILAIIVVAAGMGILYLTGGISFDKQDQKQTTTNISNTVTTTEETLESKYKGTIVVKKTYIFIDGIEVDGIKGVQDTLKYAKKDTNAYKIISENADEVFLYNELLPILTDLGFYDDAGVIPHDNPTGLMAQAEIEALTTTEATTKTTKPAKEKTTKANKE